MAGCGTSFWLKMGHWGHLHLTFWAKLAQNRSILTFRAGSVPGLRQTPPWKGGLGRRQSRSSGQADELAQVESGGGHTELEIGFGQAGAVGIAGPEEVGQVENEAFDEGALFDVLLELLSLVVLQGGQDEISMVANEDLAMRLGLAVGGTAVGQGWVGG